MSWLSFEPSACSRSNMLLTPWPLARKQWSVRPAVRPGLPSIRPHVNLLHLRLCENLFDRMICFPSHTITADAVGERPT